MADVWRDVFRCFLLLTNLRLVSFVAFVFITFHCGVSMFLLSILAFVADEGVDQPVISPIIMAFCASTVE